MIKRQAHPRREEDRELLREFGELQNYVCPVHFQDREETKEHRTVVCGKIADVKKLAESALPRWVFVLILGGLVGIGGAVMGFFWKAMSDGQHEILATVKDGNTVLHRRITEAVNDTDAIKDMVRDIQKQQAVLDTKFHTIEQRLEKK